MKKRIIDFIDDKIETLRAQPAGFDWERKLREHLDNTVYLEPYGFKVYSQNDEDGIITEIFRRIGTTNKRFIEFGVENGIECNSHYLLLKDWTGLWIEANPKAYKKIQQQFKSVIKNGQLKIHNSVVACENINSILQNQNFTGEIDLLCIDIDGNDYHIMKAITTVNPRVIIIEYNALLPPECEWIMKYDPNYCWNYTSIQGASLKSLEKLGKQKGYKLVGTNVAGVNAFFVREDLTKELFPTPATAENLYNPFRKLNIKSTGAHPTTQCLKNFAHTEDKIDENHN